MKKLNCFTLFTALLLLANCGGSQHSVEERYVLVATNIKLPYWQAAAAGLARAAAQLQVKSDFVGPDTYDPKAQQEAFHRILGQKQKPTGILLSAADPDLMKAEIDDAIGQGIPVITVDSDAPSSKRLLFIGTDNYRAGVMGGQVASKHIQGRGLAVIFSMPEQTNLRDRLKGYQDAFSNHSQIKIEQTVNVKGDPRIAFDKTSELIEKKTKVDAFLCLEATACSEVAEVLSRHRITGKTVVAMDTDGRTLEWIQKGVIAATIAQKPFTMAYYGVKILDDLHHHKLPSLDRNWSQDPFATIPSFVDTGATLVDKSNLDSFIQARDSATATKGK